MTRAHWMVLVGLMMAGCGGEMTGDEQSASELAEDDTVAEGKADGVGPVHGAFLLHVVDKKGRPVDIQNLSGTVDLGGAGADLDFKEATQAAPGIIVEAHRTGGAPNKAKNIKFECVNPKATIDLTGQEFYYTIVPRLEGFLSVKLPGTPTSIVKGVLKRIKLGLKILSTEFQLFFAGADVVVDCAAGTFTPPTSWGESASSTGGSTGMVPPLGGGSLPPLGGGTGTVPPLGGGTSSCAATRYSCNPRETAVACATRNRTECPRASITSTGKLACCF